MLSARWLASLQMAGGPITAGLELQLLVAAKDDVSLDYARRLWVKLAGHLEAAGCRLMPRPGEVSRILDTSRRVCRHCGKALPKRCSKFCSQALFSGMA
jgi:hypothetical protein